MAVLITHAGMLATHRTTQFFDPNGTMRCHRQVRGLGIGHNKMEVREATLHFAFSFDTPLLWTYYAVSKSKQNPRSSFSPSKRRDSLITITDCSDVTTPDAPSSCEQRQQVNGHCQRKDNKLKLSDELSGNTSLFLAYGPGKDTNIQRAHYNWNTARHHNWRTPFGFMDCR